MRAKEILFTIPDKDGIPINLTRERWESHILGSMDKAKTLNYHYDREEDILYVTLGDSDSALCIEQGDGLLVRIDPESGEVVGFTVIDFSQRAAERVAIPVYAQFALPK